MGQMPGPHCGSHVKHLVCFVDDVIYRKAEEREQLVRRSRLPIARHPNNRPFQPNILVPVVGNTGFYRPARADVCRQDRLPVRLILGVEDIG